MCYIPLMRDAEDRERNVQIETWGWKTSICIFLFS